MKSLLTILALSIGLTLACRTNETPKQQVDDLKITAQVKSKLVRDLGADSITNISVNTTNTVVTLSGPVDSAEHKTRAGSIAAAVPGVTRVNNDLQVAQSSRPGL